MHNAINFMKAARKNRPNEQHLSIDTRLVDELLASYERLRLETVEKLMEKIEIRDEELKTMRENIKELQAFKDKAESYLEQNPQVN